MTMLFGHTPQEVRQVYFDSWQKYCQNQPLQPLETQIVAVIKAHPEYQPALNGKMALDTQYFPELGQTNPFLHMGLHLAIREQVATDRPPGIQRLFMTHLTKSQDELLSEHLFMNCLAECLWQAQKNNTAPDELAYLKMLQKIE